MIMATLRCGQVLSWMRANERTSQDFGHTPPMPDGSRALIAAVLVTQLRLAST